VNFFAFDLRKAAIVLIVIALPLLSINMKRSPGEDPWYSKPFTIAVSLVQGSYSSFASGVRGTTSMYLKLMGIKKQNLALQKENEELRAKLGALAELKLENERLNKLLDFKQSTSMELLAAKVIARDISPDHYSIRINRGTNHGLKKLQGVITVEGAVGYVLRAESDSAQILVLTDRFAAVDGIVQRTRARGLISGASQSSCRLRYLERADDVSPGDMVVTSGLGGYFPKGFPIGKITSVRKTDFGISQEASVEPVVNPANLEEVFVVLNSGQEDFTTRLGQADQVSAPGATNQPGTPATVGVQNASAGGSHPPAGKILPTSSAAAPGQPLHGPKPHSAPRPGATPR
jgi:rod shape-determining protein MreC